MSATLPERGTAPVPPPDAKAPPIFTALMSRALAALHHVMQPRKVYERRYRVKHLTWTQISPFVQPPATVTLLCGETRPLKFVGRIAVREYRMCRDCLAAQRNSTI